MISKELLNFEKEEKLGFKFQSIAHELINNTILTIGPDRYRICEISFYYHSSSRPDIISKKLTEQKFDKCKLVVYTEKSGHISVDLTFGPAGAFGGILIRGLSRLDKGLPVHGSSKVGNIFCEALNSNDTIIDPFDNSSFIRLLDFDETKVSEQCVFSTPRFRYKNQFPKVYDLHSARWIFSNMNYSIVPVSARDMWQYVIIASQVRKGNSKYLELLDECKRGLVESAMSCFYQGLQENFYELVNRPFKTDEELAKLYGAWWKEFYPEV